MAIIQQSMQSLAFKAYLYDIKEVQILMDVHQCNKSNAIKLKHHAQSHHVANEHHF